MLGSVDSADCKRGRRKGATSKNVKNRQKVSKMFSTLFVDNFRAGQKTSKIVKKCQKVFRHFSTIFARHLFSGPFCNPLIDLCSEKLSCVFGPCYLTLSKLSPMGCPWHLFLLELLGGRVSCDTVRLSQQHTPSLRALGFSNWCLNMANWMRYPLPLLCFRLGEHAKWRCDTPPPPPNKRGISAILAGYPMKTRENVRYPLCDAISKGYCAIWGVSRTGPLS